MADLNSSLPVTDTADGTAGSAAPSLTQQVGGSDGSNLRTLSVDSTGKVNINNVSGTVSLPTGASTSSLQTTGNTSLSSIDGKTPALGQALAAASVPVVLTAAQLTALTPLSSVAVTQSTSPWVISGTVTANAGTNLNTSLLSTSSNQTSGSQKTQVVDSTGNSINSFVYNSQYALFTKSIDGPGLDNLQRLRVSETSTILSLSFDSSPQSLLTNTATTGSATITSVPAQSAMQLALTTSSSDSAILQTKEYVRYEAGRSYITMVSGNIGAKKANTRQRVGYFDSSDGIFFEQTGTDLAVVMRTSTSGSPVDTRVLQANWNLDKLDGTGASGVTLDTSKHNVYIIDFLWLGAGRVRWGVDIGGMVIYCHQFSAGNVSLYPFTRTPSLPVRAELTNTGTPASGTTLNVVCFNAQRESQDNPFSTVSFSQSRGTTVLATTGTIKPLISIRPKLTFNGITNRIPVVPGATQVLAGSQNTLIQVILNPTLTGASFTSADPLSAVEYDITATAVSGGTIVAEIYCAAGVSVLAANSGAADTTLSDLVLSLNVAGTVADILCVAVTSLAGGTNTLGSMGWEEYQ